MSSRRQFYALYLARFAAGFGIATVSILLPFYVETLRASDFMAGLFYTAFTLVQTLAVVPLAYWGDSGDKRRVLLACLALGVLTYAVFGFVASTTGVLVARGFQGVLATGMGLLTLGMVGELATGATRANHIGKANASRFAASILGMFSAAVLYQTSGFAAAYVPVVVLFFATFLAVLAVLDPDDTRVPGFPFSDLALNRRILTLTSFRAPYAVAVTLTRSWLALFAGVTAARGGLGYAPIVVTLVLTSEKFTNMLCQPFTGRLSDRFGRSLFVFAGGLTYGVVALLVPFTPAIGDALGVPTSFPYLGELSAAFLPLVLLNGLLGVADSVREPASMALFADEGSDGDGVASSFGIRELVWRPGSVLAPLLGGWAWSAYGMDSVFYIGGASAVLAALLFLAVLAYSHGPRALTEW
ncbi:MFS transporter [Salarchaeum japonicum]|uniref:Major facilitator superfamily (MFS) profile domain-containing protein n=1 Tax=Salarchaeum japonicum TaxID=555573 RepID=A0AAV3T009_9EURY|nr:MFS transporter [Salarchaeum japonicum]